MKLYHRIRLFEVLWCFLFFCNNPIIFTDIYAIINTWKNEYTFSRKEVVNLFLTVAHFVATSKDHICTLTLQYFIIYLMVNCSRRLSNDLQLTFFSSKLVFWFSGNVIIKAHWRKQSNSIFTKIIFKINYKSQFSFTCFPWN